MQCTLNAYDMVVKCSAIVNGSQGFSGLSTPGNSYFVQFSEVPLLTQELRLHKKKPEEEPWGGERAIDERCQPVGAHSRKQANQ